MVKKGVSVTTIKPGFVDTPMTAAFKKGALWAQPDQVAQDIVAAVDKGKTIVYTPSFWRVIMLIIKHIPEFVFIKLTL
jgi:short-subunit dehydrogenase